MQTLNYKGHQITVFTTNDGDKVFINKGETKLYNSRTTKNQGLNFAKWIIDNDKF